MKTVAYLFVILALTSCAAMKSTLDESMDDVSKESEKLGAIVETASDDVQESFNPAKDVSLVLSPEVASKASMEIRNLKKTTNWKNIVEVYAMGLADYEGKVTALLFNEKGTQLESVKMDLSVTNDTPQTIFIQFSEGMSVRKNYMVKLNIAE